MNENEMTTTVSGSPETREKSTVNYGTNKELQREEDR